MRVSTVLLILMAALGAIAAEPTDTVTFQGSLTDPSGVPVNGDVELIARFYDAATVGNQILVDAHQSGGTGPVPVANGVLSVALGQGVVSDGTGPGIYTSLTDVFADYGQVWVELQIDGEILSPRTPVTPAPQALNAARLDGRAASAFLDTGSTSQTKAGTLSATTLRVNGGALEFDLGGSIASEGVGTLTLASKNGSIFFEEESSGQILATLDASALDVRGLVRIQGGNPASGRVLTSDGSGLGRWEDHTSLPADQLGGIADAVGQPSGDLPPFVQLHTLHCGLGPSDLTLTVNATPLATVTDFVAEETMPGLFRYRVALETPGPAINHASLIGQPATVTLSRTLPRTTATTSFKGVVIQAGPAGSTPAGNLSVLTIGPAVDLLRHTRRTRIFQDKTVAQILDEVMADAGIAPSAYEKNLTGSYPSQPMVVQWEESDLVFLTRILAREGIHLHHTDDGATLVIGDAVTAFDGIVDPIAYLGDDTDPGTGAEFIATLRRADARYSSSVQVRAFDADTDSVITALQSSAGGVGAITEVQVDVATAADATRRAQVLRDRDRAVAAIVSGTGPQPDLRAGTLFTIDDQDTDAFDGDYLATGLVHFARRNGSCVEYASAFTALPASLTYRPPVPDVRPLAEGPTTATVTGPSGEQWHTDEKGRIKVQFHGDRFGPGDENASAWLPVIAPPGKIQRDVFLPEIDDEVLVDFLHNDPSQPVVVGSLPSQGNEPRLSSPSFFADTAGLYVDGYVHMWSETSPTPSSAGRDQTLFFYSDGGSDPFRGAWLTFNDTEATPSNRRFELSHSLLLDGALSFAGTSEGSLSWTGSSFTLSSDASILGRLDVFNDLRFIAGNSKISGLADLEIETNIDLTLDSGRDLNVSAAQDASLTMGDELEVTAVGNATISANRLFLNSNDHNAQSNVNVTTMIDDDNDSTTDVARWFHDGSVAGASQLAELDESGNFAIAGRFAENTSFDLAETFLATDAVEPGDLVRLDPDRPGAVRRTTGVADPMVLGVVSTDPGIVLGGAPFDTDTLRRVWGEDIASDYARSRDLLRSKTIAAEPAMAGDDPATVHRVERLMLQRFFAERFVAVALAGRVPVRVRGPVAAGDSLAPGADPGVAVRARPGDPVIGTALEALDEGGGLVLTFVHRGVAAATASTSTDPASLTAPAVVRGESGETPWSDDPAEARPRHVQNDRAEVLTSTRGWAEPLPVSLPVEPGAVLVADRDRPGYFRSGTSEADPAVVGIAVDRSGARLGDGFDVLLEVHPELADALAEAKLLGQAWRRDEVMRRLEQLAATQLASVATGGTTRCLVDASYGAVAPGDLLTTSPTPGHAQRTDSAQPGTVVAKALEPLDAGTGSIRVLVMLR
jgi:type VI secretion system VgrG family protein